MAQKQKTAAWPYAFTVLIFIAAIIFWSQNLDKDPPLYYSGLGQALSTDPPQYVYHARNNALFGDFDPFDYPRWTVYQHSLTSLAGWVLFSLSDVGMKQAAVVGIIFQMGALVLLLAALYGKHSPWVGTALSLAYLFNVTVITYGRLSFLENGLVFLSALVMFVYVRFGSRLLGLAVCSALVAIAMLTGKLFGALLLPALLAAITFSNSHQKKKAVLVSALTFLGSLTVLSWLLYSSNLTAAFGYVGEQSYGLRGFPEGLKSPWAFLEHLISYGYSNRLFYISPDLVLMLAFGSGLLTIQMVKGMKFREMAPAVRFTFFWLVFALFGLMPLNYSPLRYALFIIPPISFLAFSLCDTTLTPGAKPSAKANYFWLIALVGFWMAIYQIAALIFYVNNAPVRFLTWLTLPGAFAATALLWYLFQKKKMGLSRLGLMFAAAALLLFSIAANTYRINERQMRPATFDIKAANQDLAYVVGENAVLSGPYAPAFTSNNRLQSFIHLFGVAEIDSSLFDRYPITHLAIDVSNWNEALKAYPQLEGLTPVTTYWIRDYEVKIYDVSKRFINPIANKYNATEFEIAANFYHMPQPDSAFEYLNRFLRRHPDSRSGLLMLSDLYLQTGRAQELLSQIPLLLTRFSSDFYINLQCGRYYQFLAFLTRDNFYLSKAQECYARAVEVNPFRADYAARVYNETMQLLQKASG